MGEIYCNRSRTRSLTLQRNRYMYSIKTVISSAVLSGPKGKIKNLRFGSIFKFSTSDDFRRCLRPGEKLDGRPRFFKLKKKKKNPFLFKSPQKQIQQP